MKLPSLACGMLLATIILVTVRANAAPVHLFCKQRGQDSVARQATVDETLQTAFFGTDAAAHANFSETNIKWSGMYDGGPNSFESYKASFVLDRVTGVLDVHYAESFDYSSEAEFECNVSRTKF